MFIDNSVLEDSFPLDNPQPIRISQILKSFCKDRTTFEAEWAWRWTQHEKVGFFFENSLKII